MILMLVLFAIIGAVMEFIKVHWFEIATIVLQGLLLALIIKYTRYTGVLAKHAQENLETLHMPAVVLGILPRQPGTDFNVGWYLLNCSGYDAIVYPMGILEINGKRPRLSTSIADNFNARNTFVVAAHTKSDTDVRRVIHREDIVFENDDKGKRRGVNDAPYVTFTLEAYYRGTLEGVNADRFQHIGPLAFERRVRMRSDGQEEVDWVYDEERSQTLAMNSHTLWGHVAPVRIAIAKSARKS